MKMGIKEFRERLGEVARGEEPVSVTHHGRVVGHYLPVDGPKLSTGDLDAWVSARARFRAEWQAKNADWRDQLTRMGWDEEGELFSDDPRR